MFKKSILILLLALIASAEITMAQNSRFEKEKFAVFFPIDHLVSLRTPILSAGIEFKTINNFSISVDYGMGLYTSPSSRDNTSDWSIQKVGIKLKRFYKKKYSRYELRNWRRRIDERKKAKLQNPLNKRIFYGIQLVYNPEVHDEKNRSYSEKGTPFHTSFESATVLRKRYSLGLLAGYQKKMKNNKSYFEISTALGVRFHQLDYVNVVQPRKFTALEICGTGTFFYQADNIEIGQKMTPYVHLNLILGFW